MASKPSITRSISESLFGSKKRSLDSDAASSSTSTAAGTPEPASKKPKLEEPSAEFLAREKEYDDLLKPEDRKWRPYGYKLNPPPEDRPVRIYADGVFDLFHLGHMKQLEQCKKTFPNVELIVGVPNDRETHKRKGLTVLTDKQRYETIRHCRWVDEVIEDAPWILDMDFLKKHHIDYCAHDDLPYVADGIDDIYKPMKEAGMFIATQRTEGISTSDLITKIIRDYDKYLMRNFARGATRQELNVSWLKKNELDVKKHISGFVDSWKQTNDKYHNITKDLYTLVREQMIANNAIPSSLSPLEKFARKFNANGLQRVNSQKSLLGTMMDWVGFQSEPQSEEDQPDKPDDDEQALELNNKSAIVPVNKAVKAESAGAHSRPKRKVSTPKKTTKKKSD